MKERLLPLGLFIISFAYYAVLSAKQYTWLFVSQDSGDWLAASQAWFAPQPVGSPLYILLGHFLNLFPGGLPIKMTILLSCLPSAVTVVLVYLITLHLTGRRTWAFVASLVLLGAAVFLSQSTVLEEYALATCFLVAGFYFYLQGRRKLTLLMLGLSLAVHIMVLVIALLWLIIERRQWREWLKASWVFILVGVLPYGLIPVLMALRMPPYLAGYFSWNSLYEYVFETSGTVVAQISVFDFPRRIMTMLGVLLVSLGLAIIPAIRGIDKRYAALLLLAGFPIVYHATCIDPSTWTFLSFGIPFIAILSGLGLAKLQPYQARLVVAGAVALMILNGVFFNAGHLAKAEPVANEVEQELRALPDGAAVLTVAGSYSLCMYKVISEGKEIMPIIWADRENRWPLRDELPQQYLDYRTYMYQPYGIDSLLPIEVFMEAVDERPDVYVAGPAWLLDEGNGETPWTTLITELIATEGDGRVRRVVSCESGYWWW